MVRAKTWEDYPAPVRDLESGCLLWQGPVSSEGYGKLSNRYAHRVAYERAIGPIPVGHQVDHVRERGCIYRLCVEPTHLEAVTQRVNVQRQPNVIAKVTKTHCPKGHRYTKKNTLIKKTKSGIGRECRRCHHDGVSRRKRERRAAGEKIR